jgi:excinuclease ABC subunit C
VLNYAGMTGGLKKIPLNIQQKELLEKISGQKIYVKNAFGVNQAEIEKLLEQGKLNAQVYLQRHKQGQTLSLFEEQNLFNSLVEIQKKLGLKKIPQHIECYDISHFAGKQVYGSLVTFIDGRPVKKLYRLFKTTERNDDYANLQEVLKRRLERWVDSRERDETINIRSATSSKPMRPWALPDLIIIDGGRGQLSAADEVLSDYCRRFEEIQTEICSLAKREEEVFLPNNSDSIIFQGQPKFLLQRIRDEAHRFGITNQRKATVKESTKSNLEKIPGIGQTTKQKLLSTFGSVDNLIDNFYTNPQLLQELLTKTQFTRLSEWLKSGASEHFN